MIDLSAYLRHRVTPLKTLAAELETALGREMPLGDAAALKLLREADAAIATAQAALNRISGVIFAARNEDEMPKKEAICVQSGEFGNCSGRAEPLEKLSGYFL